MKALRPLTIIPQDLYVERTADKQLEQIILNMGRPGYVLVARQMGKTNLLLNARRKRLATGEVFSYLDVSNEFPDARSFFRNIIDTTIETSSGRLDNARDAVIKERSSASRLPHKEHEWELRHLLSYRIEKLIICLDEIDALTRCTYSDQIFSFIRSVYFSGRSNFEEFNRLTYLLSGVAEPTEIIKNKDISPFNIGEKIYLEDFSENETKTLLKLAGINMADSVVTRIYTWISGYPRMTWDVCSELESLRDAGPLNEEAVDSVVRKMYFAEVETPPIDHIKRMVEESAETRDALMSIHYNRSEAVSEPVRARLYLAGISKMAPEGKALRFKNRVLEESLSEDFLLAVGRKDTSAEIDSAIKRIEQGYVARGYADLESIETIDSRDDGDKLEFWRGRALLMLDQLDECVEKFQGIIQNDNGSYRKPALFFLGIALQRSQHLKDAAIPLAEYLASDVANFFEASVAYSESLLNGTQSLSEAELLCMKVVSNVSSVLSSTTFIRSPGELICIANILLCEISRRKKRLDIARDYLAEGINFASLDLRIRICVMRADIDQARRRFPISQAALTVSSAEEINLFADGKSNSISILSLSDLLIRADSAGMSGEVDQILDRVFKQADNGLRVERIVEHLVDVALLRKASNLGLAILERSLRIDKIPPLARRTYLSTFILLSPNHTAKYWPEYLKMFPANLGPQLADLAALNNIIISNAASISPQTISLIQEIIQLDPIDASSMDEAQHSSLDLLRRYLSIYRSLRSSPSAGDLSLARKLLEEISDREAFSLPGFGGNHARLMQEALSVILRRHGIKSSSRQGMKIGRNEIVEVDYAGEKQIGKYKKFELDLQSGVCKIIRRLPKRDDVNTNR